MGAPSPGRPARGAQPGSRSRGRQAGRALPAAPSPGRLVRVELAGSVAPDRVDHDVTQFMQTAVKEVPDSGHYH
jgi:hypothetical protein